MANFLKFALGLIVPTVLCGQQYPQSNRDQDRNRDRDRADYRDNYRTRMTVPAGSEISVRTDGRIDSARRDTQTWPAQVDRDILGRDGEILIPRGADVQLVVRHLDRDNVALDLDSISLDGRQYFVDSEDVDVSGNPRDGVGANRRTGEFVGGGAVLGTLLGAIAGGGKGAAIGALAGGAVGAGAQVVTRGDHISVPAETILNFRLERPLNLSPR